MKVRIEGLLMASELEVKRFGRMRYIVFIVMLMLVVSIGSSAVRQYKSIYLRTEMASKKCRLIYKSDRPVIYSKLV